MGLRWQLKEHPAAAIWLGVGCTNAAILVLALWPFAPSFDAYLSIVGIIPVFLAVIHPPARTASQRARWRHYLVRFTWMLAPCVALAIGWYVRPMLVQKVYQPRLIEVASALTDPTNPDSQRNGEWNVPPMDGFWNECSRIHVRKDGGWFSMWLECRGLLRFWGGTLSCQEAKPGDKTWMQFTYRDERMDCGWIGE